MKKQLILTFFLCSIIYGQTPEAPPNYLEPGAGTADNPYHITNLDNLCWIFENPGQWDKHYKQTDSIDASVVAAWNDDTGWMPVGNNETPFSGKYDGQGKAINNLYIFRSENYQGLFGYTNGCTIENIRLTNVNITSNDYTGGLVGYSYSSIIRNCFSTGSITGGNFSGGLFGSADHSTVTYTGSISSIAGGSNTGGLIGGTYFSTVSSSYSNCNISGGSGSGGLVGYAADNSIITTSYSTSSVVGMDYTGGLVGETYRAEINNCYSIGNITGHNFVGGFIGYNSSSSTNNCYSSGRVKGILYVGGFMGIPAPATNCFWNKTLNPALDNGVGTGITYFEMRTHATYLTAGWDFLNETDNGLNNFWGINETGAENGGYPFLQWQGYSDLMITDDTPLLVKTIDDLKYLSENQALWDKSIKQTANINISVTRSWNRYTGWNPIGNNLTPFTGKYDGQGFTIDSLYIYRPDSSCQGLFGKTNACEIKNVNLTNIKITCADYTGSLIGANYNSTIVNCSSGGTIKSKNYTGGLIGVNDHSTINYSSSTCNVNAKDNTGGLTGTNVFSEIIECNTSGNINGGAYVGGLTGYADNSTISSSYFTGTVNGGRIIGGLVGANAYSTIIKSFSSGIVNGGQSTGGLVGYAADNSILSTSYSSSSVKGSDRTGGLVGETYRADISNCYNSGSVTGSNIVGGLIGNNESSSSISNCFSCGIVKGNLYIGGLIGIPFAVNNSFWDKTVNPTLDNGDGTGKTTEEMKSHSTYTNAGWDPDTWCINENFNNGYPFLAWQSGLGIPLPVELDEEQENELPKEFRLMQNYPNPFNPTTRIEFYVPSATMVTLKIYDILGSEIAVLVNDERTPGKYTAYWNGKNNYGRPVSSGVYIYKLTAGNFTESLKMNLLK